MVASYGVFQSPSQSLPLLAAKGDKSPLAANAPLPIAPSDVFSRSEGATPFRTPATPLLGTPFHPQQASVQVKPPQTLVNGSTLYHYALANGHQLLLESRPSDTVSLRTFVKVGSTVERPIFTDSLGRSLYNNDVATDGIPFFKSGLVHYDEHKHFDQTQHYPTNNEWTKVVEAYGASLNASTGEEQVQHELHFNREDWVDLFQLHAEQVLHPLYDATQLTQEKRNVINESYERMSHPQVKAQDKLCELLFDRPFFQTLGSKEDVEAIEAQDLQRLFDTYYQPNNMMTVISGDLTPEQVLPLMEKTFGARPPSPTPPNERGLKFAMQRGESRQMTLTHPRLKTQSYVLLGFQGPAARQVEDRIALEVLLSALTSDPQAPLQKSLVQETGHALDIGATVSSYRNTGSIEITALSNLSFEGEIATHIANTLNAVAKEGLPQARFEDTKEILKQRYRLQLDNQAGLNYLIGSEALSGSLRYATDFLALIDSLSQADLKRVAQQYLSTNVDARTGRPQNALAVVYMLPGERDESQSKLSSVSGALPTFNHYSQPTPAEVLTKEVL